MRSAMKFIARQAGLDREAVVPRPSLLRDVRDQTSAWCGCKAP
jgi:hypothetical protein